MAQTQINVTEKNEKALKKLRGIMAINEIKCERKKDLINKSIELADKLINGIDDKTFVKITGLTKIWK